ncbi:MAG: hypothetical protein SGBAC_012421 [Bacillariaceae sp.]
MSSYGAVDTKAQSSDPEANAARALSTHSFQELDMRFLKDEISPSDRRRKLITTWVPILIAVGIMLIFAKVALGAIGPYHDPKYPSEYGSRPAVPASTSSSASSSTRSSKTTAAQAPSSAPASSPLAVKTLDATTWG